jgi:hypothetical protein
VLFVQVLTNVAGGLAECAKFPYNQTEIRTSGGIPKLIVLLNGNNGPMLENVCRVLGECANEIDSMDIIDKLDGVRLIWSQLKHASPAVQASAAWALCPCIQNARVMKPALQFRLYSPKFELYSALKMGRYTIPEFIFVLNFIPPLINISLYQLYISYRQYTQQSSNMYISL